MLKEGTKLGPYEILSPIGKGGMGEVYRAKDTKLDREVAIKVLPADVSSSPERLQRFEREAKTVAALNHPNIVTIHAIEESGDHRFIAMELVEGETLDRMIAPGGMPLAKIFDIAIPLSDALAAAHDKGIVHRDLKPANVMVTKEGRVKVLDFGLAKLTATGQSGSSPDDVTRSAPLTGRGVILGTVPYMSPEQLKSKPVDHRSDIFSLGIMLYEMASGVRPFTGDDSATVMSAILRDTPRPVQELNSNLPRHLGRIVEHCLKKNPDERYQSAKDVRNELRELRKEVDSGGDLSESQPVSAPSSVSLPPPSGSRVGSGTSLSGSGMSAPTRRGEFWIGIGVLAVTVALAAWWLGRDVEAPGRAAVTNIVSGTAASTSAKPTVSQDLPQRSGVKNTLAILPFENISTDPDTDYLSNEIPASIIDKMSGLSGLSVISRSGAFRFDPAKEDASSFGKSLGVSVVLTGQLNARGDSLTIRAELVDVATNQQLWSKRYSRDLSDIMAVEADITQNISEALRLQLTREEKTKIAKDDTENPEAYRAYIEARFLWNRRSEDGFDRAIRLFDQAISLDPQYARAYAGKADCYLMLALYYRPSEKLIPLAKQAINTALHLDDSMAEAYASLGWLTGIAEHEWGKAEEAFQRGTALPPRNATLHHWGQGILPAQSRFDEALSAMKRANEIDPNSLIIRTDLAGALYFAGSTREALAHLEATLEMDPDFFPAKRTYATMLMGSGQPQRAIRVLKELIASAGRIPITAGMLGVAYAQAGRITEARDELKTLTQLAKHDYVPALAFAFIHASLGNVDEAFRWLDKSYQDRELWFSLFNRHKAFYLMHGDPRFDDLLRRIGLEPNSESASTPGDSTKKTMLAVLPFANLSGDPEQEYFSDGMTEEMITRLGRIQPETLGVIARTSAMRYKNTRKTIAEIGHELGVAYVVEGGVSRSGNNVRINVQLIQVSDQTQLWGDSFTRDLSDVFAIQAEVAEAVAGSLAMELLPGWQASQPKSPTTDSAAYDAYLKGRYHWNRRTGDSLRKSLAFFHEALRMDPAFALAYAGLAQTYVVLGGLHFIAPSEATAKAHAAASRALELNDSLGEAYTVLAVTIGAHDWKWEEAIGHFERAIRLNPNHATAHHWHAEALVGLARFEDALREIKIAKQLDPLSPIINASIGRFHSLAGDFDEAARCLEQLAEFDNTFAFGQASLGGAYLRQGKFDEGVAALERAVRLATDGAYRTGLGRAYVMAGQDGQAKRIVDELRKDATRSYQSPYSLAGIFVAMERFDEAFELLSQACDSHDWGLRYLRVDSAFEKLRGDPRFDDLLRRIGLEPNSESVHAALHKKTMLAVLPFANLSGDPEQEYFSDGMTEEMITRLGRLRPELLGVIARTSAMRYKKTNKTINEIGRELGVAYVIEGGVRRAGSSVRISAQLIQVSDQTQLWGDSYTRDLSDVFAIQAEVAEAVAKALAVELLPQEESGPAKPPTESSAAYDAYLLGRSYWAKRTPESLHAALKHFKRAIKFDPNYALAYSGLADTWSVMPWYVPGPYNKINAEAMKAAERALALNDSLAEAHVSMACVLADGGDWETANEHYQEAVAIDPNNATAHQWYGGTLSIQGRFDQATEEFEKAITLDPLSAVMHNEYGDGSVIARRFDKAIEQLNKAIRLQSNFKIANYSLTWAYIGKEDHDAAAKAFESYLRAVNRSAESIKTFRRTFDASGLRAGFLEWLDSLGNDSNSMGTGPERRAPLYAWCNEKDRAFESLGHAMQRGSPLVNMVATYFPYDNLRDDPRYVDLLERIGARAKSEKVELRP